MILAVDIGNSNVTFGIFDSDIIIETNRLITHSSNLDAEIKVLFKDYFQKYNIEGAIISSVVKDLDKKIKVIADNIFNIESIVLDLTLKTDLKLKVDNPQQIGKDRLANAVCHKKYPCPAIIIDIGTATTFDIIDKDGYFTGGIIIPGVNMQFEALNHYTSLLPKLSPKKIDHVIGKNTEDNILSGVIRGHACAISGLVKECEKELGQRAVLIGTGGLSEFITEYMERPFDYIDKNLTLNGLNIIYKLNKLCPAGN